MQKLSKPRIPAIACPHCQGRAIVRSSETFTPLYRELRLRCEDDECGHAFVASLSVIRTVTPSQKPNPSIQLPLTTAANALPPRAPANDDMPYPANDIGSCGPEVPLPAANDTAPPVTPLVAEG
ncbi:MAG TPA: ogr/Delta-like zinc finger family protein [Allosphingosinicella sp.]|uniref:ogr/Delta-like zinc finger family protein n=1 Tax=Allosphingosinicella sp. TaxID=2823234 RepID=UPI002ED8D5B8